MSFLWSHTLALIGFLPAGYAGTGYPLPSLEERPGLLPCLVKSFLLFSFEFFYTRAAYIPMMQRGEGYVARVSAFQAVLLGSCKQNAVR